MQKNERIKIAQNTLEILEQGYYINSQGTRIDIKEAKEHSVKHTVHYTPESLNSLSDQLVNNYSDETLINNEVNTLFEVINSTTLEAAQTLINLGVSNLLCLNFASAKNPGGDFLNGSQAQEESLARSSGLYPCLIAKSEMYKINRGIKSCLYSDNMIYSPDVPVLKDDEGNLLDRPYPLSFITSPAVNAGVVKRNELENISQIEPVMLSRIEKMLSVAFTHGHKTLILGAWGCGVFQNEPDDIAKYFAMHLKDGKFKNLFRKVVFAIKSKEERFIQSFKVFLT